MSGDGTVAVIGLDVVLVQIQRFIQLLSSWLYKRHIRTGDGSGHHVCVSLSLTEHDWGFNQWKENNLRLQSNDKWLLGS